MTEEKEKKINIGNEKLEQMIAKIQLDNSPKSEAIMLKKRIVSKLLLNI